MNKSFEDIKNEIINAPLFIVNKVEFEEICQAMDKIDNLLIGVNIDLKSRKKIYVTSIELLQNAFRHGKQNCEINFIISKLSSKFYILSENHILADQQQELKDRLEKTISIANKFKEELKNYYKSMIREGRLGTTTSELGFVDIMRKSTDSLLYNFKAMDNDLVLFSIIAIIDVKI